MCVSVFSICFLNGFGIQYSCASLLHKSVAYTQSLKKYNSKSRFICGEWKETVTGGPHRGFLLAVLVLSGYAPSMEKRLFGCGQIQQALFLLVPLNGKTYPFLSWLLLFLQKCFHSTDITLPYQGLDSVV